jgi:hypothetical protein
LFDESHKGDTFFPFQKVGKKQRKTEKKKKRKKMREEN